MFEQTRTPAAVNGMSGDDPVRWQPATPREPPVHIAKVLLLLALSTAAAVGHAETPPPATPASATPTYDAALAKRLGADARGMRHYVLVILKTGPTPMAQGKAREAMFDGHFANITRLAKAGKLALAGPFEDNPDGWRGLFVFAVETVDEARALTQSDPVIRNGEMVAEYHPWYGSAATMLLPALHERLVAPEASDKD